MRSYTYYIYSTLALWLCCSCIDEFEADIPDSDAVVLCVEGTIRSNADCAFFLSHSIPLHPDDDDPLASDFAVYGATIAVAGSNGERWKAPDGSHVVSVGTLDPASQYWLEVTWQGNTYTSTPLQPLPTPDIGQLSWGMAVDGQHVSIMVTPAAAAADRQYFRWEYEETWEVHTPLRAVFDYNPATDAIVPAATILSVGWASSYSHPSIYGTNENYQSGQIRNLVLYNTDKDENRFNHRYYTRVTQTAISREEYEYERLSTQLSDEMGGLFTPQPSALPTNIRCQTADVRAIGYVGVSLNSSSAHLYINREEVGHREKRSPVIAETEFVNGHTWNELWTLGWRVYEYHPEFAPPVTWASRWCVDCTAPYWGASLIRPAFWEDK